MQFLHPKSPAASHCSGGNEFFPAKCLLPEACSACRHTVCGHFRPLLWATLEVRRPAHDFAAACGQAAGPNAIVATQRSVRLVGKKREQPLAKERWLRSFTRA